MQTRANFLSVLYAIGLATLLSACSSTTAGLAGKSANSGELAEAAEADPLICEMVIPAGTRVGRRVCIRTSERDRIRENAQSITQENQRRAVTMGNPSGN